MQVIAHRANLNGPCEHENQPEAIRDCLAHGFGVELDLWTLDGEHWLGHYAPKFRIDLDEFDIDGVYFHLKTPHIPRVRTADAFAIDRDPYAVTMRGRIWTNYGQPISSVAIMCAPELVGADEALEDFTKRIAGAFGICTDFPARVKEL
jgi:hypothetical protein